MTNAEYNAQIERARTEQIQILENQRTIQINELNISKALQLAYIDESQTAQISNTNELRKNDNARIEQSTLYKIDMLEKEKEPIYKEYVNDCQKAYIKKMKLQKQLPQILSARGSSGGTVETSNVNVETKFQNEIFSIQKVYNQKIKAVDDEILQVRNDGYLQLQENNNRYDTMIVNIKTSSNANKLETTRKYENLKSETNLNFDGAIEEANVHFDSMLLPV